MKKLGYIFLNILFSACAATRPTPSATPKVMDMVMPEISSTPKVQPFTKTPQPTKTIETHPVNKATKETVTTITEFSVSCKHKDDNRISPNGEWLAVSCSDGRDSDPTDPILEIVNRSGKHWELKYQDYVTGGFGGFSLNHWSNNSDFLYFSTYINREGGSGSCFYYSSRAKGLYRIRVADGAVSPVLPASSVEDYKDYQYEFAFSQNDHMLAYQKKGNLIILDLQNGNETTIKLENSLVNTLTWSTDGLELAYATCTGIDPVKKSAINIFSIEKQSSRTILEMDKTLLAIARWNTSNVMEIIVGENNYPLVAQPFDLNTSQWLTPTPTPQSP